MTLTTSYLGQVDYLTTVQAMQDYTAQRDDAADDLLWICEHPALYTQGLAGKSDHILNPGSIPVIQTNRGGQVTFHGPGQIVAYPLMDLKRAGYYVKEYVYRIEEAVVRTLANFGVTGHRVRGAPLQPELEARVRSAVRVELAAQPRSEVRFGAEVTVRATSGPQRTYAIVGVDEARAGSDRNRIAFTAPLARALLGRRVGDLCTVRTPRGEEELEILAID